MNKFLSEMRNIFVSIDDSFSSTTPWRIVGNISALCNLVKHSVAHFLLDWLFCDWEFGVDLKKWDRKVDKQIMTQRLQAFQKINTSKNTIGYHWTFMTSISDLYEVCHELGCKKIHNWIAVSTHKQSKKGGNIPFIYSTQLVSCSLHSFVFSTGPGYGNRKTHSTFPFTG